MLHELSDRQRVVLAALAASPGEAFAPVQVQKMFFLIDENISDDFGGKQFKFEPYDYGPFDKSVYHELDYLAQIGLVSTFNVYSSAGGRRYTLTNAGQAAGNNALGSMTSRASSFITEVSAWVRTLSFAELVGSIYKAFPHMRERSIFVE